VFRDDGQDIDWLPPSNVAVSDDVLGVVSMAQSGAGICQTYDFIVQDRVRAGSLVEVLPHLRGRTRAFSVIYAPHRRLSAASRALIDMIVACTADH
jgi:DNA-binding transcriptional LysR family regulator